MGSSSVDATRDLCDDLESLVQIAKQNRAPIRALSFIERARADLQAYLEEIDPNSSAAGTASECGIDSADHNSPLPSRVRQ